MVAPSPQPLHSQAVAELLAHAIDYAGLYPPAALPMGAAVREYHAQRSGPHAWALGRFVVGADQVAALLAARRPFEGEAWPVSLLVAKADSALPDLTRYTDLLRIEAVEVKAGTSDDVAVFAALAGGVPELYVEVPLGKGLESMLDAVRTLGARAKIRTGGITPDAIPPAESVARFIRACVEAGVPFKATAGLHHLIRGEYPLTYEPGSASATMFGFLNIFVAAAFAVGGAASDTVTQVLEERDIRVFRAAGGEAALCWQDRCLTADDLRVARVRVITGFGSCSFGEPMAELVAAGLTDAQ